MKKSRPKDCDPLDALDALDALNENLEREEALRQGADPDMDCLEPLSVPDEVAAADRQDQVERNAVLNDPERGSERS